MNLYSHVYMYIPHHMSPVSLNFSKIISFHLCHIITQCTFDFFIGRTGEVMTVTVKTLQRHEY